MTDTHTDPSSRIFSGIVADTERVQLSQQAHDAEPRNFLRHVVSLSANKVADGLVDPKLVLSWLMSSIGAPSLLVGLLVPVREAGALLPQAFTGPRIGAMARRKWAWAGGAGVQGLAALIIAAAGLLLGGWVGGLAILAALAVLATARSICSVSYKDVLGRTVDSGRRGTATGLAGTISAGAVILFALALMTGAVPQSALVIGAITLAGVLWICAGLVFSTVEEEADPAETRPDGLRAVIGQLRHLREDHDLALFVAVRGLLVPTALAPPYLVLLAAKSGDDTFQALGSLVLASALATLVSAYIWGRLADRSSRLVLAMAGVICAALLIGAVVMDQLGAMGAVWVPPAMIFAVMVAYQGVRLARSTYLVDLAPEDKRTEYTAVANTLIGLILLGIGGMGAVFSLIGPQITLIGFAVSCAAGAIAAMRLREV